MTQRKSRSPTSLIGVAAARGAGPHPDFNRFMEVVVADASAHGVKLTAKRKNLLQTALASREEAAAPVIKKTHKPGAVEPDPVRGLIEAAVDGQRAVVEHEPGHRAARHRAGAASPRRRH